MICVAEHCLSQVDSRYQCSNRSLSPPSTPDWRRSPTEAVTDSGSEDLHIRRGDDLSDFDEVQERYQSRKSTVRRFYLFRVWMKVDVIHMQRRRRSLVLVERHSEKWPGLMVWHGAGDIAALFEDRRLLDGQGKGTDIVEVLTDVPLRFYRRSDRFCVKSNLLVPRIVDVISIEDG